MVEEIHSNGHAVGVYGIYKDHSAPPQILSEIYEEMCTRMLTAASQEHRGWEWSRGTLLGN